MIKIYFLILGSIVNILAGGFVFWIPLVDPSAKVIAWSTIKTPESLPFLKKVMMTADYFGYSGVWSIVNILLLFILIAFLIANVFKKYVSQHMLFLFLGVKFFISLGLLLFSGDYVIYAIIMWVFQIPLDIEVYRLFRKRYV